MGAWLEAFERLSEEQKERVARWIHLNKFIAHTLRVPWDRWVTEYLTPCMEHPLDYSFVQAIYPQFAGLELEGQGASFSRGLDPSTRAVARVPLRAKNNLGRLSPAAQDQLARLLEGPSDEQARVSAADVVVLQKIFPKEKALAQLKKPDFRRLFLSRDEDDIVFALGEDGAVGTELLRMNLLEISSVLSRTLV